jgi:hypothetical protein
MSVFMVSSIRVIKGDNDFITNAGIYLRLLSGYGANTVEQAIEAFEKGFAESKFALTGWELIGQPTILEVTKNYVESHMECFAEETKEEPAKPANMHLKVIK